MTAAIIYITFHIYSFSTCFYPKQITNKKHCKQFIITADYKRIFAVHNAKFQVLARLIYKLEQMQKRKEREPDFVCVCVIKIIAFVTASVLQKRLFLKE